MTPFRRLRLATCLALAMGAGVVAAVRAAPLGPRLQIDVLRRFSRETFSFYDVKIRAVGGETIERVMLEPLRGAVRVHPPGRTTALAPGAVFISRVSVGKHGDVPPAIRILQHGRVERQYDVELGWDAP